MLKVTLSTFVELVFLYSDNKLKKKVGRGGVVVVVVVGRAGEGGGV